MKTILALALAAGTVAQVKDKAVGLMGLTKEVDLKLLHKCFDLDAFDNLLKAEFMDAVRNRRELI